jgi:putative transposase
LGCPGNAAQVLLDEYTRQCLAIRIKRQLGRNEVFETLVEVLLQRGTPELIRSDSGPEFVAQELREWLVTLGTSTLYIEPGVPGRTAIARASTGSCGMSA